MLKAIDLLFGEWQLSCYYVKHLKKHVEYFLSPTGIILSTMCDNMAMMYLQWLQLCLLLTLFASNIVFVAALMPLPLKVFFREIMFFRFSLGAMLISNACSVI